MTIKVNGGIKSGFWAERKVDFVTLTFGTNIVDPEGDGTLSSAFDYPDTALDVAVQKLVQNKAVLLAVGDVYATGTKVDLIVGHAQGWSSDEDGVIASAVPVVGKQYGTDGKAVDDTLSTTVTINYAKLSGLDAAVTADLVEFPVDSGEYWTKREF
jgi:hypothetical protein